jgi:hypothetical protein
MTSFNDIYDAQYYNKKIKIKCIVSGKSTAPYCIPKKIQIECVATDNVICKECPYDKNKMVDILAIDENILKFIDTPSISFAKIIKDIFKIECNIKYEAVEMQNIERLFVLAPTGKERNKFGSNHIAYYVGCGLEVNTMYQMSGYATIDPKNQTTTHVFTSAKKIKSDIESFSLLDHKHEKLLEFSVDKPTTGKIYGHLEELYKFYAHNITKIHNRFDLHLSIDLAFKSALHFNFDNEYVHKGWMDVMVIGDTRCGKGYVAERLASHFNLGEVVSGENASFAGLVGGLQQYNGHWVVTWGKLPLNDGGLLILDEAGEVKQQDWAKLSRIRSEGVAEIVKINTQITNARTRIIYLANPRKTSIATYSYGIQSILDVIETPEDIARFDYILVVAHNEVTVDEINKHKSLVSSMYSSKLENELILWVWSRKTDEIKFSDEAIKLVYKLSIQLAKMYSFTIPLIQGENIRVKLSKIAISFAGRVYSNKQNGQILFVTSVHVECAYIFFNLIYKKESCSYYAMSQLQKATTIDFKEKDFSVVQRYFDAFMNKKELCKCLLTNNRLVANDISEHLNLDITIAREIISRLLRESCIIKQYAYYVKTPAFTNWLKKNILTKGGLPNEN